MLGSGVLALAGLVLLPSPRLDRGGLLRLGLDLLMVGTALGVASWALVVAPALAGPGGERMAREYGMPYSVASVITLAAVVLIAARARGRWLVPVLLICAGLAVRAIGRITLVGLLIRGEYHGGGPLDLIWPVGFLLMAAAAVCPPATPGGAVPLVGPDDRGVRARVLLPYLPVAVALIAAAMAGPGLRGPGLMLGSVAVIVLLLARQVLTALDNAAFAAEETRMAYSDPLTGLGNRALLAAEVARAQRMARGGGRLSLLLLDLDGFKAVNDSLGHEAGDRLLVRLARRLAATVGPDDVVARLGGDEFAVLVEDEAPGAGLRTAQPAAGRARRAGRVLRADGPGHASASAWSSRPAATPVTLLRDADVAMYAAKSAGKAAYVQFEPAMRRAARAPRPSWRPTCGTRWTRRAPAALPAGRRPRRRDACAASRRWCAGSTRAAGCCRRPRSSRWPRRSGWSASSDAWVLRGGLPDRGRLAGAAARGDGERQRHRRPVRLHRPGRRGRATRWPTPACRRTA